MNLPIIQHELRQIYCNRKAWFGLSFLQAMLAIIFYWLMINFIKHQASTQIMHYGITEEVIHPFYGWYVLLMLLFLPLFATQSICAEKQNGTMINYYCSSFSARRIIFNKYISLNILLTISLLITSIMPICIIFSGQLDWGLFLATLLGVYLMLNAAIAFCLGIACFMQSPLRANIIILLSLGVFVLLEWAAQYAGKHALFLQSYSLLRPLKPFLAGVISVRYMAYYLLIALVFLCLGSWRFGSRYQYD
jgi:ABC-type transport system involved in multi-copper enzyme maturation permease subunit